MTFARVTTERNPANVLRQKKQFYLSEVQRPLAKKAMDVSKVLQPIILGGCSQLLRLPHNTTFDTFLKHVGLS